MTHLNQKSEPVPKRLRPDSERALRQLRLAWLLGWRVPDIAAWLGVAETTARRRLRVNGLRGPALDGEQDRLIADEVRDRTADALMASDDPLAKELVAILSKLHTARPKAAAPEP